MRLNDAEIAFLQYISERGGQCGFGGLHPHGKWDRLVTAGYVERTSTNVGSNFYTLTAAGSEAIGRHRPSEEEGVS